MDVRFWGVRGSVAVSGEGYRETGGNTSCLEVRLGERQPIQLTTTASFDAATPKATAETVDVLPAAMVQLVAATARR